MSQNTAPRINVDLWAPCTTDIILEVRTGKMKKMPGLEIESGIDKGLREGAVRVTKMGFEDDEHDLIFHGGVDKAVHGYCCSHYPGWAAEHPSAASRFCPGGFGENLVLRHMNERNVCIGDVYATGDNVLLQVSLPRQPCFKLNHRFQLKNFAPETKNTSRTGWYYRVLREGQVKAGDSIILVERKWPTWTIERIQKYLYQDQDDFKANEELASIEAMGEETRGTFRKRVAKAKLQARREAMGQGKSKGEQWRDYRIVSKRKETERVAGIVFEAVTLDTDADPLRRGGLHVKLLLPNGLQRTYSVVSAERDGSRFELGVALEPASRGGSRWLHDVLPSPGALVKVGRFTTDVPLADAASNHVFIAGGIGITAFLALMERYRSIHFNFELHYAIRSADDLPYRERLESLGSALRLYDAQKGQKMDIDAIVRSMPWNSQFYVCGPLRLMDAARDAVEKHGISEEEAHFEAFGAETGGDPFEVEVANRQGRVVKVGEDETLLEALKKVFGADVIDSSCEVGNCKSCKIGLKAGNVDHKGTALSAAERETSMLSCVSRGIGKIVVDVPTTQSP